MAASIATVRTVKELRAEVAKWRKAGETVALVPTMGALHAGHLSLIDVAKSHATRVVASIFVNPAQFGPKEDFKRYPRDEAGDLAKLAQAGVDLVYIPDTRRDVPAGLRHQSEPAEPDRGSVRRGAAQSFRGRGHGGDQAPPAMRARRGGVRREGLPAAPRHQAARPRSQHPGAKSSPGRSCARRTGSRSRRAMAISPPPSGRRRRSSIRS